MKVMTRNHRLKWY